MLRITLYWWCCVQLFKTPTIPKKPHRFWILHLAGTLILFSGPIAVTWHCRKCNDNFLIKLCWISPRRKWLVNHCPLSHFAHGELAGLGTLWVVAVLNDSCGAQCLKLSSNVWHMVCVSLWPVTLVALNSPVTADWLCTRWGTGKGQSMNLEKETTQCEQLRYQMALTNLLRSPLQYLVFASLLSGNV